jgi:hypothetical protein
MRIDGHAVAVDAPRGWEAKMFRPPGTEPTLHLANFPLPPKDGDYGAGALSTMGPTGVFAVLTEFDPALATEPLFAQTGLPVPIAAEDLSPKALQHRVPGQAGLQRFFNVHGRAFCLYVVVGTQPSVEDLVQTLNAVLAGIRIGPRAPVDGSR